MNCSFVGDLPMSTAGTDNLQIDIIMGMGSFLVDLPIEHVHYLFNLDAMVKCEASAIGVAPL
ncbi:MAG: hypothetical protein JJU28_17945 [Cyclobacteriaceae bacterium]|nr:hypothetical protein [Cyclobacteriaceae bacterium]